MSRSEEEFWMELAVLFFDSPEPKSETMINATADSLRLAGWTKKKTEEVLVGIIAPHAKRWLGYGLPLTIGEEIVFWDKDVLIPKMKKTARLRKKYALKKFPFYYFLLSDFLNRRLLIRLGFDRLLNLLQ